MFTPNQNYYNVKRQYNFCITYTTSINIHASPNSRNHFKQAYLIISTYLGSYY